MANDDDDNNNNNNNVNKFSQQGATLYDVPASAPVGHCSARKRCLYFRNIASIGRRFQLTIYFHFNSLFNASNLCRSLVPMSSIEVIVINKVIIIIIITIIL